MDQVGMLASKQANEQGSKQRSKYRNIESRSQTGTQHARIQAMSTPVQSGKAPEFSGVCFK